MGQYSGPTLKVNGLILALDVANPKSYTGVGSTNSWFDVAGSGNNATRTDNSGFGGQVTFNPGPSGYFDFTVNPYVQADVEYGYFAAGYRFPSVRTYVQRIDYSNDTVTASLKGPLSVGRYRYSATGNSLFGYFISTPFSSSVERTDYSNDTAIASPKGPLSNPIYDHSATGNNSYGYALGGYDTNISTLISRVERIDYSNDTATASVRGPLSENKYRGFAATGNASYGYNGGGGNPFNTTRVDRIDYSNDTATASPKGPLSRIAGQIAATGNSSYGYFGGGDSTVDRIDYSNDTATASVKGPLSLGRYSFAATGNSSFGYFGGGVYGSPIADASTVDRIDYSNDTATASVRGPLVNNIWQHAAASPLANGIRYNNSVNGNGFTLSSVTVPTTGGFSISAFIKRDTGSRQLSEIETIFSNGIGDGWFFGINTSGNLYYAISGANGTGSQEGSLGGSVADAEWHMVTVVFDRAADLGSYKVYGYVDGVESGNATITAGAGGNVAFTSNAPGVGYSGFYGTFGGEISNIYTWNRVLTASEVLENYNELKRRYET